MIIWDKLTAGVRFVWQNMTSFFLGKVVAENVALQKENQKLQKQIKIAASPDVAWDKLLKWLQSE